MAVQTQYLWITAIIIACAASGTGAAGQNLPSTQAEPAQQIHSSPSSAVLVTPGASSPQTPGPASQAPQPLFDFKDSDIKFNLGNLMNILRDQRHEGWVLAAYPDPNTHRPLIGAGFSLDLPARDHPQTDPLNPHQFLEPSSAQLWQAAGLDPQLLQSILDRFDRDMSTWSTRQYRKKIRARSLSPELTEEEATSLLRVATIQAVYNAKAYCRNFDQMTASQQMALSQLVYQMGVNLEEFVQFRSAINGDGFQTVSLTSSANALSDPDRWHTVQTTLIESQWAHRYSDRASTVIAMFDPDYAENPAGAERRVEAVLHPPSKHRRRQSAHLVRTSSSKSHSGTSSAKHSSTARKHKTA